MTCGSIALRNYEILRELTIRTQPIKIFFTNGSLLFMAIFNDNIKKNHTAIVLNLSDYNPKLKMSCLDVGIDTVNYTLYALCKATNPNAYHIMRIILTTDKDTSIINGMVPQELKELTPIPKCQELKIVYVPVFRPNRTEVYATNSLLYYCSNDQGLQGFYLTYSPSIKNLNGKPLNCSCCDNTKLVEYDGRRGLIFVNKISVWAWNGTCENRQILVDNASNFLKLKIGAAKYLDDLYVLTNSKLFMKFPGTSNTLEININEDPTLLPVGLAVTLRHVYVQLSNMSYSMLKIFEIEGYSTPRLISQPEINRMVFVMDTGNYYTNAEHLYYYDHLHSNLTIFQYRGLALKLSCNIPSLTTPKKYNMTVMNLLLTESYTFVITVMSFSDKSIHVNYSELRKEFQQQIVKIDLRQYVTGPLLEFFSKDE